MSAPLRTGYKQTEVGVIPGDWEVDRLDLFWSVTDCKHVTAQFIPNGYPLASIKEVQSRFVDLTDAKQTTQPFYNLLIESGRKPQVGDLIISRNATVGEVAQVADWHPLFAMGQDVCLIRKRQKEFSSDYLQSVFRSNIVASQLSDSMVGSTFKRINVQQIKCLKVPMPAFAEQRAIAAALSDVDALLAKLDAFIAKKRDLKQAAMQQLLTGQTRLPGFSGEWVTRPIASFSAFVTKGATPTTYGFKWESDGVIFLRSECVSADGLDLNQSMFISEHAHAALIRGEVRPGDILITITGNVGRAVLLDRNIGVANINQHIARIRVKDADVSPTFVFHWLSQPSVRHYYSTIATGQAYPQISLKQVRETLVPLVSIAEQTAIATVLSDMDAELTALEARRDKTRALKQGMMQELLTGRIRLVSPTGQQDATLLVVMDAIPGSKGTEFEAPHLEIEIRAAGFDESVGARRA